MVGTRRLELLTSTVSIRRPNEEALGAIRNKLPEKKD